MKKLILLFSLTVALAFYAKAQTSVYHPFPDSDAVWNQQIDDFDNFYDKPYMHLHSIIHQIEPRNYYHFDSLEIPNEDCENHVDFHPIVEMGSLIKDTSDFLYMFPDHKYLETSSNHHFFDLTPNYYVDVNLMNYYCDRVIGPIN